ncbi:hypothetical protein XENTR_v10017437 [Xenopus tropicalis]|nr:hypothetical protein XENTR_v10017437 [Xenopus tropicalis]
MIISQKQPIDKNEHEESPNKHSSPKDNPLNKKKENITNIMIIPNSFYLRFISQEEPNNRVMSPKQPPNEFPVGGAGTRAKAFCWEKHKEQF